MHRLPPIALLAALTAPASLQAAVLRFNASYSFAPRIYVQANVQYNDDTDDVGTNIRLGWLDTAGTGLFIATVWLLARSGHDVGRHLRLLSSFFPGYSVTWPGAFIGFFYGALVGAIIGWSVAWVYNQVADRRHPS